jgi:DHA3 family tetracycline resistance protein-like MFS transporter
MLSHDKRLSAFAVYLMLEGAAALFLGITYAVNLVYQVQVAHLNALQLVLIGTALEGTIMLLQVPTGIFADVYSRRLSILLGIGFLGLGGLTQGAFPVFGAILLSSAIAGIGYCFLGGAEEAWIAGEVGEERIGHVFLRGSQIAQVGSLAGVIAGTGLGMLRLDLPLLTGGTLMLLLALVLALVMPERHFSRATSDARPSWGAVGSALRQSRRLVQRSPVLLTILAVAAFYGMSSEGFDRLNVAHFLQNFSLPALGPLKPVAWFGFMSAVATLLSLLAMEFTRRRVNTQHPVALARGLLVLNALLLASVIGFGLAGTFVVALVAFWCVRVLRKVIDPLYMAWITVHAAPEVRATIISLSGQMDAFGQVTGGPVVGAIGVLRSLRAALVSTGVVLMPAVLLYARAVRDGRRVAEPGTIADRIPAPIDLPD